MTAKILAVSARQVLDSRGNPTVEAEVRTELGTTRAIAPSGASTGIHEALELRDGKKSYGGLGVLNAVGNVCGPISKKIVGLNAEDQEDVDRAMIALDGTENKARLGANATAAVSMAVCWAGALSAGLPLYEYVTTQYKPKRRNLLPAPMFNVINGGKHAGGGLACQEIIIQPANAKDYPTALMHATEAYHDLKKTIGARYGAAYTNVGDEGGLVPPLKSLPEALSLLSRVIDGLGYEKEFVFGIDAAASVFYSKGKYALDGKTLSPEQLKGYYLDLEKQYPLRSFEDVFQEDAFDEFAAFTAKTKSQVVGDDLLVTNPERIKKATRLRSCNALLLKINQVGTVTEAMQAARTAHRAGWNVIVSHRSGEAEDGFIADFSVGIGAGQIKAGAPARGERTCKYNQLLRIGEELGSKARYCSPYE